MSDDSIEVVFTIDSPQQEPLARAVQEFLEAHGIPCAVSRLPFITALPNPQWGTVAVRARDAAYARKLIQQQFQFGETSPPHPPEKV